jgi:hypothetical protein
MNSGRFEVWFISDDQVSVVVETSADDAEAFFRETHATAVFSALAAGIIANLPKEKANAFCSLLADFDLPANHYDIPTNVGDRSVVRTRPDGNRKGFEGKFDLSGAVPSGRMKTRGFGLFGSEVQDYAQTAVLAVLLHLLHDFTADGRIMLVGAANSLGRLGLAGAVGLRTHPHAAETALEAGDDARAAAIDERE